MPIIAIDFDGTITEKNDFKNFTLNSPVKARAISTIQELKKLGCIIIIWTCRYGEYLDLAVEYLKKHNIPFDYINENAPQTPFQTSRKIFAHYYIDDLNIGGFPGWEKVLKIIKNEVGETSERDYIHH